MTWPHEAGDIPSAEKFGEGPTLYPPVLTGFTANPNLGANGAATGWWVRNGPHRVRGEARFLFSGAGLDPGTGAWEVSLPLPADTSTMTAGTFAGGGSMIGSGFCRDSDTSTNHTIVIVQLFSATTVRMYRPGSNAGISNSNPFTWAEADRLSLFFDYIIEEGV